MITCPVCEHQQDNSIECEVCGRLFLADVGGPPVHVEQVEGLEATLQTAAEVPVQALAELEATRQVSPALLQVERLVDIEPSRFEAQAVAVERLAELSQDRAPDDGVRTALPQGPVTCRYCRNVQAEGGLCDACGMKILRVLPPDVVTGKLVVAERVRCRACGAPALPGERCGDCGRDVPFP